MVLEVKSSQRQWSQKDKSTGFFVVATMTGMVYREVKMIIEICD